MKEKRRKARSREEKRNNRPKTQWCSGITCVLARLRAHYPEHQHKEEEEEEEEEDREKRKTSNETSHPHTTPPPFHNPQHSTTRQHAHHPETRATTTRRVDSGQQTPRTLPPHTQSSPPFRNDITLP